MDQVYFQQKKLNLKVIFYKFYGYCSLMTLGSSFSMRQNWKQRLLSCELFCDNFQIILQLQSVKSRKHLKIVIIREFTVLHSFTPRSIFLHKNKLNSLFWRDISGITGTLYLWQNEWSLVQYFSWSSINPRIKVNPRRHNRLYIFWNYEQTVSKLKYRPYSFIPIH